MHTVTAVGMWLRRDARHRVRSLVALAAIVALALGIVLGALAGARRNRTAMDRLFRASAAADEMVLPNQPGFDWNRVRALPFVVSVGEFDLSSYTVHGGRLDPNAGMFAPASPEMFVQVERGVIVAGRRADPSRSDEVVMTPSAQHLGLHLGSHVQLRGWRADKVGEYVQQAQPPPPDGPIVDATVVGIVKSPFFLSDPNNAGVVPTNAFYRQYHATFLPYIGVSVQNALVRLRRGDADLPALSRAVDGIAGHPVEIARAQGDSLGKPARDASRREGVALYGFALAAGLAALVLVGQAVIRMVAAGSSDMPTLQSLGVTRVQRTAALAVPTAGAALAGVVGAVVVAIAVSDRFPIGVGRVLEPAPGRHADWFVLGLGALAAIALVGVGVVGSAAWYVWRGDTTRTPRRSTVATAVRNAGAPVPLAMGTQLALERTPGRAGVPVRPALVGAVVGIIGVVGALTFRAGLDHAASDRTLYGQQFDAGLESDAPEHLPPGALHAVVADPDVAAANSTEISVLTVNGRAVTFFGIDAVKGATHIVTVSGRAPARADELVLAPTEASALGVHAGAVVHVGAAGRPFRLAGIGFTPVSSHTTYSQGGWIPAAGLRAVDPGHHDRKYYALAVAFRPGVDVRSAITRLNTPHDIGVGAIDAPTPMAYLRRIRGVPVALGAFLVLLAVAAIGHALASMVGRRRRELAVLRALGLTRGQARACVAWQATTLAVVGLVFGIPLGIVLGRAIWRAVADATPVEYVPPFALVVVLAVVPLAIVLCNLLAAWPARRAARLRAAEVLRAE